MARSRPIFTSSGSTTLTSMRMFLSVQAKAEEVVVELDQEDFSDAEFMNLFLRDTHTTFPFLFYCAGTYGTLYRYNIYSRSGESSIFFSGYKI